MTIARRTEMTQRITTPDAGAPAREFANGWPSMTDAAGFADKIGLVQATPVGADGVVILTYEPARDGR
jgi:hypothetical protein